VADCEPIVKSKSSSGHYSFQKCGIVTSIQVCIDPRMITWRLVNQEGWYNVHGCTRTPVGILCNDKGSTNAANKQRYSCCRPKDHAHAKQQKVKEKMTTNNARTAGACRTPSQQNSSDSLVIQDTRRGNVPQLPSTKELCANVSDSRWSNLGLRK
jgi:hypothetical protein